MKDQWVSHRSARDIKRIVRQLLERASLTGRRSFCVVQLVERFLADPSRIKFFDAKVGEDLAYVSYNPTRLNIDRTIWHEAKIWDPKARYILAHELGHLTMHSHAEMAFSNVGENQLKSPPDEQSAERQANVFAHFLLVPDEALLGGRPLIDTAMEIAVPIWVVATVSSYDEKRGVFQFIEENAYTGDLCERCGSSAVFRNGLDLHCADCGVRYRSI